MAVPINLETERLQLRPFHWDDAERTALLAGVVEVALMTRTIPSPYSAEQARTWFQKSAQLIETGHLVQYAVTMRDDGSVIGNVTLRKSDPSGNSGELSYWIGQPFWALGIAVEAANAVLDLAAPRFGLTRVVAAVMRDNTRSIRVLQKLGFEVTGTKKVPGRVPGTEIELQTFARPVHY